MQRSTHVDDIFARDIFQAVVPIVNQVSSTVVVVVHIVADARIIVALDDWLHRVRRAVVDQNQLEVPVRLLKDAAGVPLNVFLHPVDWYDDGD